MENAKDSGLFTELITKAIQVPGVKITRDSFLVECFKKESQEKKELILRVGPVEAGCSREQLKKIAIRLVNEATLFSTSVSFIAGIPGGWAMAAAIPADMLQFYAVALRLAQQVAYLYGEEDLWCDGCVDSEKVTGQLIIYCGVMLGATGASQLVRVVSAKIAQNLLKQIPRKPIAKLFFYPIVKSIARSMGIRMTKSLFAKGVSKAVPIVGGVISGGITLASMKPMGMRLVNVFDNAKFVEYTQKQYEQDISILEKEKKKVDSFVNEDDLEEEFIKGSLD